MDTDGHGFKSPNARQAGKNGFQRTAGATVHATQAARCGTGRADSISKNKPAYEM